MGYWWIIRSPILFAYLVRLSVCLTVEQCDEKHDAVV